MASISPPPDEVLIRYLLGELAPVETERLDEQSVADPAFFDRLDAVENDLIDSYIRRDLPYDLEERFRTHYLTSEARAQKVRFAAALARHQERPSNVVSMKPRGGRMVPWLLPLAATIAIVGLGLLFLPASRNAVPDRPAAPQVSQTQPGERPAAPQPALQDPAAPQAPAKETLFAFTLAAPRRGVDDARVVAIPATATDVTVRLELDSDDFPRYRVVLKQPSSDRTIWRSGALTAEVVGAGKVVPALIPARHFDTERYWIELEGLPSGGTAEQIATYAFRVVR
jgi:hypothetical protein